MASPSSSSPSSSSSSLPPRKLFLEVHQPFRDHLRRQLRELAAHYQEDIAFAPTPQDRINTTTTQDATNSVNFTTKSLSITTKSTSDTKNQSRSQEVALRNFQNVMYTASIQIDKSTFQVIVDTGSSDLWVTCAAFKNDPEITCTSSTTTNSLFGGGCGTGSTTIRYGSGNVCVVPQKASIHFGGIEINDYMVGIAQGSNVMPGSPDSLLQGSAQGILGLAYKSIATVPSPNGQFIDQISNFSVLLSDGGMVNTVTTNGGILGSIFGGGNNNGASSTAGDVGGKSFVLLNGVDDQVIQQNNMTGFFVPLKAKAHWTVSLGEIHWDDTITNNPCTQTTDGYCDAILDTGTSLVSMPASIYSKFVETYLQGKCTQMNGVYSCPKSTKLPNFGFTLGSASKGWTTFQLTAKDYTMTDGASGLMVVELQKNPAGLENTWILGDTFLRAYYSLFIVNEGVTLYCPNGQCQGGKLVNPSAGSSNGLSKWYENHTVWAIAGGVLALLLLCCCCSGRSRRRYPAADTYTAPNTTTAAASYPPPQRVVQGYPGGVSNSSAYPGSQPYGVQQARPGQLV